MLGFTAGRGGTIDSISSIGGTVDVAVRGGSLDAISKIGGTLDVRDISSDASTVSVVDAAGAVISPIPATGGTIAEIANVAGGTIDALTNIGNIEGGTIDAISRIGGTVDTKIVNFDGDAAANKNANYLGAQSGAALWIASAGKKAVLMGIYVSSTLEVNLSLVEGTSTILPISYFAQHGGAMISQGFPLYKTANTAGTIKITSSASTFSVMLTGYEI